MNNIEIRDLSIELSSVPLEEKTIMFIEDFYRGARGLISGIFKKHLSDPLYEEYKLVWVARDYEETLRLFGEKIESDRVWLCINNGYDYVRFLNLAKIIYTGTVLPGHFIKREGQLVYYAPSDYYVQKKSYTKTMLWRLGATINNADSVIVDRLTTSVAEFSYNYRCMDRVKVISSHKDENTDKKMVMISFTAPGSIAKNTWMFHYLYEKIRPLTDAYEYELHWKAWPGLYQVISESEYYTSIFENVHSSEEDCTELFAAADITVSDSVADILLADKYCENLIFFNKDEEEMPPTFHDMLKTEDFESFLDIYEGTLGGELLFGGNDEALQNPVLFDCPKELCGKPGYEFVKGIKDSGSDYPKVSMSADDRRPRVLIIAELLDKADFPVELHKMLLGYRDRFHITVMYGSPCKGLLYEVLPELSTDIVYICPSNIARYSDRENEMISELIDWNEETACTEEYDKLKKSLKECWWRVFGRTEFAYTIAIQRKNIKWKNKYVFIPSPRTDLYKWEKAEVSKTVENIKELLEKYYLSVKEQKDAE